MGQIRIVTLMDTSSERILDYYLLETIKIYFDQKFWWWRFDYQPF